MLLVAGVNLRNPVPRFWDPESPHHIPGIRALMVSFAEFLGYQSRNEAVRKLGLRKYLRIPDECQVFLDNGAFHTLMRGDELNAKAYCAFVEATKPDWYPIPVEHIPHPMMKRAAQEALYRKTMIYNRRYTAKGYVPVVHAGLFLPKFLDGIERLKKKTKVTRVGLGAMVPFLLRGKGSTGRTQVVDDILAVRGRLPNAKIHGFGIGGTATLHIAAVLGLDSVDSSGWRNRAARGIIQLRGTGDRIVAKFGKWRGRALTLSERQGLHDCGCPACRAGGPAALEVGGLGGFAARATHNLWVLVRELQDIEQHLAAGSYLNWFPSHIENRVFMGLVRHAVTEVGIASASTSNVA
ncbi:MAG: hypothetical protein IPH44_11580 [Myxococcales bacterium]|nr:hypothetical protein [Myxococcales bacterium]